VEETNTLPIPLLFDPPGDLVVRGEVREKDLEPRFLHLLPEVNQKALAHPSGPTGPWG
jgi:hypothetical protein